MLFDWKTPAIPVQIMRLRHRNKDDPWTSHVAPFHYQSARSPF